MNQIFNDGSALNERNGTGVFIKSAIQAKTSNEFRATSIKTQSTLGYFVLKKSYSLLVCFHSGSILFSFKTSKTLQKKGIEHRSFHMHFNIKMCERLIHMYKKLMALWGLKTERGLKR